MEHCWQCTVIHTHANYDRCKPEFGVCSEQPHFTGESPITPAPRTSDSDDDSLSSGDSNDNESSGSSDDSSSEGSDEQDTSTSDDEDETEDDFEQTNPLLEQIRMSVSGALSATGISGPEF